MELMNGEDEWVGINEDEDRTWGLGEYGSAPALDENVEAQGGHNNDDGTTLTSSEKRSADTANIDEEVPWRKMPKWEVPPIGAVIGLPTTSRGDKRLPPWRLPRNLLADGGFAKGPPAGTLTKGGSWKGTGMKGPLKSKGLAQSTACAFGSANTQAATVTSKTAVCALSERNVLRPKESAIAPKSRTFPNGAPVKLCRFYTRDVTSCKRGDSCWYAHGAHELRDGLATEDIANSAATNEFPSTGQSALPAPDSPPLAYWPLDDEEQLKAFPETNSVVLRARAAAGLRAPVLKTIAAKATSIATHIDVNTISEAEFACDEAQGEFADVVQENSQQDIHWDPQGLENDLGMGSVLKTRFQSDVRGPIKLCMFWVKDPNACSRGDKCWFGHGVQELRPPAAAETHINRWHHAEKKPTRICVAFAGGFCQEGNLCRYAHGEAELDREGLLEFNDGRQECPQFIGENNGDFVGMDPDLTDRFDCSDANQLMLRLLIPGDQATKVKTQRAQTLASIGRGTGTTLQFSDETWPGTDKLVLTVTPAAPEAGLAKAALLSLRVAFAEKQSGDAMKITLLLSPELALRVAGEDGNHLFELEEASHAGICLERTLAETGEEQLIVEGPYSGITLVVVAVVTAQEELLENVV